MCQELDANPSLVDGETSTKMTTNAWQYEADRLYVKYQTDRDRQVLRRNTTVSTRTYGTLPAAAKWQHLVQKVGADMGLLCSSKCPCSFGHSSRDLDMVVHGDDFIVAG